MKPQLRYSPLLLGSTQPNGCELVYLPVNFGIPGWGEEKDDHVIELPLTVSPPLTPTLPILLCLCADIQNTSKHLHRLSFSR